MSSHDSQLTSLWDALMQGERAFDYKDVARVYICSQESMRPAKILKASEQGLLVKMPPLKKGHIYGVKIIARGGWNSFRYIYYQ